MHLSSLLRFAGGVDRHLVNVGLVSVKYMTEEYQGVCCNAEARSCPGRQFSEYLEDDGAEQSVVHSRMIYLAWAMLT